MPWYYRHYFSRILKIIISTYFRILEYRNYNIKSQCKNVTSSMIYYIREQMKYIYIYISYTVSQITAVLSRLLLAMNNPFTLKQTQVKALLCFSIILQRFILTEDGWVSHFDCIIVISHSFTQWSLPQVTSWYNFVSGSLPEY